MVERLANVIYWLGCSVAVIFVIWAALLTWASYLPGSDTSNLIVVVVILISAVLIWLIGRTIRYILTGRQP
jgi:hypothetical protein